MRYIYFEHGKSNHFDDVNEHAHQSNDGKG